MIRTNYDEIFEKYEDLIPTSFLRSLAKHESDLNPLSDMGPGGAKGLLQVVPVVLDDYNERHKTAYKSEDLFNPEINVAIAVQTMQNILASYRKVSSLGKARWDDPRWVELFVFGWNAGYSLSSGVAKVASILDGKAEDMTIDRVHEEAKRLIAEQPQMHISKWLAKPNRVEWAKRVVATYMRERVTDSRGPPQRRVWPWLIGIGAAAGLAVYLFRSRDTDQERDDERD